MLHPEARGTVGLNASCPGTQHREGSSGGREEVHLRNHGARLEPPTRRSAGAAAAVGELVVVAEVALAAADAAARAAVAGAEEASAAQKVAEAAASAAVDPMAVAAATTVWIAFDGIPPPEEVQMVLQGNRGAWLPSDVVAEDRLQQARPRILANGAADRWSRSPQLQLPVLEALKDLGVAHGLGRHAKDLHAAGTRTAFVRLQWVARLGLPRRALCRLVGGSALTAGVHGAASHVCNSDTLLALRR